MPLFGFNQGFMHIAGYNYGAKDFKRVVHAIKVAVIGTTCFCIAAMVLFFAFSFNLISIFTSDNSVISHGGMVLRIFILAFPLIDFQIIGSGLYQALGKAKASLFLALSRQILFLIPFVLILPVFLGEKGIWISFPVADILSAVITAFMMLSLLKSLKKDQIFVIS